MPLAEDDEENFNFCHTLEPKDPDYLILNKISHAIDELLRVAEIRAFRSTYNMEVPNGIAGNTKIPYPLGLEKLNVDLFDSDEESNDEDKPAKRQRRF